MLEAGKGGRETDLTGGVSEDCDRRQVFVRGLVTQLDEPSWQADLRGEGSDRTSVVGRLQRIDERVDKPAESEEEQRQLLWLCLPLVCSPETNRMIAIA